MSGWFRKRTLRRLETPMLKMMLSGLRAQAEEYARWYAKDDADWGLIRAARCEDKAREIVEVLGERQVPAA